MGSSGSKTTIRIIRLNLWTEVVGVFTPIYVSSFPPNLYGFDIRPSHPKLNLEEVISLIRSTYRRIGRGRSLNGRMLKVSICEDLNMNGDSKTGQILTVTWLVPNVEEVKQWATNASTIDIPNVQLSFNSGSEPVTWKQAPKPKGFLDKASDTIKSISNNPLTKDLFQNIISAGASALSRSLGSDEES